MHIKLSFKFVLVTLLIIVVLAFGIDFLVYSNVLKAAFTQKFDLEPALEYVTNRGGDTYLDMYLGKITDSKTAKEKAEEIWIEFFGEYGFEAEEIKSQKPYVVYYDKGNDAWMVHGSLEYSLFKRMKGGCANIIIRGSDGQVLAIWHEF